MLAAVPHEHDIETEGQDLHHHTMTLLRHAHDQSNSHIWFRLPVYPKLVLKSLGYTKSRDPFWLPKSEARRGNSRGSSNSSRRSSSPVVVEVVAHIVLEIQAMTATCKHGFDFRCTPSLFLKSMGYNKNQHHI